MELARQQAPDHLKQNYYHDDTILGWTYINDPDLKWISAVQWDRDWGWDTVGILRRIYSSGTLENKFMDDVFRQQSALAKEHGFQRMFIGTHKNVSRYFISQLPRWEKLTGEKWYCDGRKYWVRHTPQLVAWTGGCPHEPVLD